MFASRDLKVICVLYLSNFPQRYKTFVVIFTLIQDFLNLDLKKLAPHCILYFKYWLGSFVLIPEFSLKKSTILLGL